MKVLPLPGKLLFQFYAKESQRRVRFTFFSPCTKVLKALVNALSVTSYDGVRVFSSLTDKSISTKQYHS